MENEKLENLLRELSKQTKEHVRPVLADDIKRQIPHAFGHHRGGLNTIRIIIDLRVNRLAAAAVIILTMVLCINVFGDKQSPIRMFYEDTKIVASFLTGNIGGTSRISREECERFVPEGREFVYYGDAVDLADSNSVVIYWKLNDGRYRVRLGNLRVRTVTAEQLIDIQAQMIQKKAKK